MKMTSLFAGAAGAAVLLTGCAQDKLTFVHMADSQFGFYDYDKEMQRHAEAVAQINADTIGAKPDFMVMCGDMINEPTAERYADYNKLTAQLNIPSFYVPGNHDINKSEKAVKLFFDSFGPDYYTFDQGAYRVIVVNTSLWKYPESRTIGFEYWLRNAFIEAERDNKIIIVAGHSPIFLKDVDEPEDKYYNIEPVKRKEILDMFKKYGVIAYVGGHCHTRIDNTWEGIRFLHTENTCTNFDNRPYGYRIVRVDGRTVTDEFVPLASNKH